MLSGNDAMYFKILGSFKQRALLCLFIVSIVISFIFLLAKTFNDENIIDRNDLFSKRTSCRRVTVNELNQWFDSTSNVEIPKIIHQTWKNESLKPRQALWSETWCKQYTDWYYHLWTDDENDVFVRTQYPWFYSTYRQLSPAILRADSVRYLYMFHYGGIYVGCICLSLTRSIEKITSSCSSCIGRFRL
jgi:mannosyltransferase OCH1-like enzyme